MAKQTLTEQERYDKFISELEKISKKYGVSLDSCGGVWVAPDVKNIKNIEYDNDYLSGDLHSYITYNK